MNQNNVNRTKDSPGSGRRIIAHYVGIFFYIVQIFLVFRFGFKLLGANASNRFVSLIYALSAPLTSVFDGIFPEIMLENYDMLHVFEPSSVLAMVVTAIIAGIINRLLIRREPAPAAPPKTTGTTATQPIDSEDNKSV